MFKVPNQYRVRKGPYASTEMDGNNGMFVLPLQGKATGLHAVCLASDGTGLKEEGIDLPAWEHVSVSLQRISNSGNSYPEKRCPTWEEMCVVKSLFWSDEDTVIQFHPKSTEYISMHPHVLHLWRKVGQEHELPPSVYVGVKPKVKEVPALNDYVVNTEDESVGQIRTINTELDSADVFILTHKDKSLRGKVQTCAHSKLRFATQEEVRSTLTL